MRPSGSTVADLQHALVAHEVVLLLETDGDSGLPTHEARERLARFGPNELPPPAVAGPLVRLARQVHHPLVYVLLVAGAITLILGNVVDAGVIFGVVVVNAVVGFIQEPKAEVALDALRSLVQTEARVRRDGPADDPRGGAVRGDVVLVEAGDKIPADLRLVEVAELRVDESALTAPRKHGGPQMGTGTKGTYCPSFGQKYERRVRK